MMSSSLIHISQRISPGARHKYSSLILVYVIPEKQEYKLKKIRHGKTDLNIQGQSLACFSQLL